MMFRIILKCLVVYFVLFVCLRFMGKREIGQVNLFDFSIILVIADILVIGIEEDNENFFHYLIVAVVLGIVQRSIALMLLKWKRARKFFDSKESVLIYDGKLNVKEMQKQRYNMDDLITQLRLNSVASLKEVQYLVLENNGNISVFKYKDSPTNPFPLIVSGKVEEDNLKMLGLSVYWLKKKLNGIRIKDVYYASLEKGELYVVPILNNEEETK